jgi:hypothetical protein
MDYLLIGSVTEIPEMEGWLETQPFRSEVKVKKTAAWEMELQCSSANIAMQVKAAWHGRLKDVGLWPKV